jgi:hypothetical protein
VINEHANGYAHTIHAQIAGEANQIALGRGEVKLVGELRCPC